MEKLPFGAQLAGFQRCNSALQSRFTPASAVLRVFICQSECSRLFDGSRAFQATDAASGSASNCLPEPSRSSKPSDGMRRIADLYADLRYIKGLCGDGKMQEALDALLLMEQQGIVPSLLVYSYLLQKCSKRKVLAEAKQLHAHISRIGLETQVVLGEWIVNMFVRCGSLSDAIPVFHKLSTHTVLSWNALISGFSKSGQGEQALRMYCRMQDEGVEPDEHTFASLLRACGALADLEEGKRVHAEVVRREYESGLFVCTSLIDMYAKCGSVVDAQIVFDTMLQRDLGSWNSMITGYAQQGWGDKSLQLYQDMQEEGVRPDERTFVGLLAGCNSLDGGVDPVELLMDDQTIRPHSLQKVREIHAEVLSGDFGSNIFIANTLIHAYAHCGSILDAQVVMDGLSQRNLVSWNALLAGHAQQGEGKRTLELYVLMHEEGYRPDDRTFASLLKACSNIATMDEGMVIDGHSLKLEALQRGKQMHSEIVKLGYSSYVHVANTLAHMYANCGSVSEARHLFDSLFDRDVVTWNSLIEGYCLQEQNKEALKLYELMKETDVKPDDRTFVSVLKACGSLTTDEKETVVNGQPIKAASLQQMKALHAEVTASGYLSDVYVGNSLVHVYAKCGSLVDARHVFETLSRHDVVSWNAMISGYAWQEQAENALKLYAQLQAEGVRADETTFLCVLKAASTIGALKMLTQIHNDILRGGYGQSLTVASALIHAYGKSGNMVQARSLFDSLPQHNVVTWTALVAGYARTGEHNMSLRCFEEMQRSGIRPNLVTFVPLLSACSHAGMVDQGMDYFESMSRSYALTPASEHYFSIVDLLSRAGLFSKAESMITAMPSQPDLRLWLSVLGACRTYVNVEYGRRAFDHAVSLEPEHCAAYSLMQNIYADAQMWLEAQEIEELRAHRVPWKQPGQSWIEHQTDVHSFIVGDSSHRLVYATLNELSRKFHEEWGGGGETPPQTSCHWSEYLGNRL